LLDNFDDRYLGPKSSAPTVDNDGDPLAVGALYFDTTTGKMRVYTASGWLDASSASVATLAQFQFNATASQTTFSGTAAVGGTLTYTVGAVLVALNGVLLEETSDFTATNGTSIVLTSGAAAGDELNVYAFGNFLVADTYSRAAADALLAAKVPNTGINNITAGSGLGAGLEFAGNGNSAGASTSFFVGQGSTGAGFVFQRANQELRFGTNNTERMRIDISGRVTTPSQPAFNAHVGPGTQTSGVIVFSGTRVNIGSHYNTSNGTFTAPVAGVYMFNWQVYKNTGTTSATSILFQRNGADLYEGLAATTSDYITIDGAILINMAANDTARIVVRQGTIHTNSNYSYFSGVLLG
jgi:hypothetical protein